MRSMLVTLGHPLYAEVSSDQPPLFNVILAFVFRVADFNVDAARGLVLLFSTLLVWAGAQFLELTWGKLAAILFLPLIIVAPRYLNLSVAVMIGVPAIALAAVSMVFVALWHLKRKNLWLVLSGFLLALSVLIKLFTGLLAPIFLIGMTLTAFFDRKGEKLSWKVLQPALIWSISFIGLGIVLGAALIGPRNVWEILYPHLMAPTKEYFQAERYSINVQLQAAVPIILLGALGAVITVYRRNWLSLYPLAWAVVAYLLGTFSVFKSIYVQIYGILGGLNFYLMGPVVGSCIMTLLPKFLRVSKEIEPILTGAILILLVIFLPGGVLSTPERISSWTEGVMKRGKGSPAKVQ